MRRPFGTLRSQLLLLILGTLIVAPAISLALFVDERGLAVRAAVGAEAAGRAANVARLLEEAPADLRPSILRAADSPMVRFDLANAPSVTHIDHQGGGMVEQRIRALLGPGDDRGVLVEVHKTEEAIGPMSHVSPEMVELHRQMSRGTLSTIELTLSIALGDGQWLNVDTRFQRPPASMDGALDHRLRRDGGPAAGRRQLVPARAPDGATGPAGRGHRTVRAR